MSRAVRVALGAVVGALLISAAGARVGVAVGVAGLGLAILLVTVGGAPARLRRVLPVTLGVLVVGLRAILAAPPAIVRDLPTGSGPWLATVQSVGSPKAGTRPAIVVLDSPLGLVAAATLPWFPEVASGDRVEIDGRLEPPSGGDYGTYLERIGASATIRAAGLRLAAPDGSGIGPWERLRRASAAALDEAIPAPEAGLAAGILVGLRDHVDRDLAAAFTTAGVSHIVAISGWNIAIVATTLGALTGRLGRRRRTVATCLAIAVYVAFVGPSPSVVRAAAMAACALLARELGRPTTATAAMGLAVTGLLLLDPGYVDDAGFRLSVLATAGLIAWGTTLAARIAGPSPGRLRGWLAESLGVSLAAQAATLPVILLDFGRLSIVSPVVNVLVAPLVAPAMAAGGLALVVGLAAAVGLPAGLGTLAGLPAWFLLGVLIAIVRIGAGLPFASIGLDPPGNAIAAALAAAGLAVVVTAARRGPRHAPAEPARPAIPAVPSASVHPRSKRPARLVALLLETATVAVALAAIHRPDGATRITVLDVGQGDAILIEGGRGGRLLVDGGPDPTRLLIALGERLPPWDRRIDAVVLTHPHEDHVAGLAALLSRFRVGRVFEPGMIGPGPGYQAWAQQLAGGGPTRWSLGTGDRLAVDDVTLKVLWPDPGSVPLHPPDSGTSINNVSIVLLGQVAGHEFLLAGDVEQAIDPKLLAEGLPRLDFLKVAHHGSGTASTQPFLDAVQPKVAAVSVGAGNPYGHPAPATIARLHAVARQVYRTDLDGSVTVTFDGAAERVHASGGRPTATAGDTRLRASLFACSIPLGLAPPVAPPPLAAAADLGSVLLPHPPDPSKAARTGGYHRPDDGPVPSGGGPLAPLPRSPGLAPAALARRRGGRRLAGAADRRAVPANADRPADGRGGRAPPRHRQGDVEAIPAGRPGSRRRRRCVAGGPRLPGAGADRRAPLGHPSRDGRRRRRARGGADRGTGRGLCRPARPAADRVDGGAVRALGPAPPGRVDAGTASQGLGSSGRAGRRCLQPRAVRADRSRSAALDPSGLRGRARSGRRSAAMSAEPATRAPIAYFWGDDGYGVDAAVEAMRRDPARFPDGAPERVTIRIEPANPRAGLSEVAERVATGVMFGSGVLAIVSGVGNATRRTADRDALIAAIATIAPGNGLALAEETDTGTKEPPGKAIVDAVKAAGGDVRRFEAPKEGGLAAWIEARARERQVALAPGAARELATRVGGFVREGDVDRRQQGRLAVMELEKLSLRHANGEAVTQDDVVALVAEAVPGTIWGFVDAVGLRNRERALSLLERLIDSTPEPVLLAVLHRRIRELIEVADRIASGETPGSLVRSMKLQPFRAEILVRQAAGWSLPELEGALEGLLELDAIVKGVGGRAADAARQRLAFDLWITDRVAPR